MSFIMTCKIMILEYKTMDPVELRFMLTAGVDIDSGHGESPVAWLPKLTWDFLCRTSQLAAMEKFVGDFKKNLDAWRAVYDSPLPHEVEMPAPWDKAAAVHKLIIVRLLRPVCFVLRT